MRGIAVRIFRKFDPSLNEHIHHITAKRAEAKADMTGNADDIKTAGDLAAKALEEKSKSESVIHESREAMFAAARAQSALLSCAYQAVMQGDARHFDGESTGVWRVCVGGGRCRETLGLLDKFYYTRETHGTTVVSLESL